MRVCIYYLGMRHAKLTQRDPGTPDAIKQRLDSLSVIDAQFNDFNIDVSIDFAVLVCEEGDLNRVLIFIFCDIVYIVCQKVDNRRSLKELTLSV